MCLFVDYAFTFFLSCGNPHRLSTALPGEGFTQAVTTPPASLASLAAAPYLSPRCGYITVAPHSSGHFGPVSGRAADFLKSAVKWRTQIDFHPSATGEFAPEAERGRALTHPSPNPLSGA